MRLKSINILCLLAMVAAFTSCKKSWLEEKQDKAMVIPSTLEDFYSLLDNTNISRWSPIILEVSADNYYMLPNTLQNAVTFIDRNAYLWQSDIFQGQNSTDWNRQYQKVFYANVVLEGVATHSTEAKKADWQTISGSALFLRAHAFYDIAQGWAKPYDAATAGTDPGIPIRLASDIAVKSVRSTVQQTYQQIIDDLLRSIPILPATPQYKTWPSKGAAFALLARVYLSMGDYDNVLKYADSTLKYNNSLLDYNDLANTTAPFALFNSEVILHQDGTTTALTLNNHIVDSTLFSSYDASDLRKTLFFRASLGYNRFKGQYTGSASSLFGGIATDEVYLMRAEANARKGSTNAAMDDLNALLVKRYSNAVPFVPLTATDAADALSKILLERRKELPFRIGLRWMDLRRLNKSGANITLTRLVDNETYTLPPNDNKYALPFPLNEIQESGFEQNPR